MKMISMQTFLIIEMGTQQKQGKEYTPIDQYKPSGNFIYNQIYYIN